MVIDGITNSISAVASVPSCGCYVPDSAVVLNPLPGISDASDPLAVNPLSDEIYVASTSNIAVIDGATDSISTIAGVTGELAINSVTESGLRPE